MAEVADAVAWPPSISVISSKQTDAPLARFNDAFAALIAAAIEDKLPPAIRMSHAGSTRNEAACAVQVDTSAAAAAHTCSAGIVIPFLEKAS